MIIGSKIFHKNKIYNSLDWAKENINTAPDGSIFLADNHEYTKGRQDRIWIFDKDQLAVTILLKPDTKNSQNLELRLNQLNMAITLGILKPLEKFNIVLKWPNDFYYKDSKVGGILSQVIWKNNKISGIIFGFSININNHIQNNNQNFKASSLCEISRHKVDKENIFQEIINSIDIYYKSWINFEFKNIFNSWRLKLNYLIDKNILIHKFGGEKISGKLINILENGDISIKTENNKLLSISFNIVENFFIN